MVNVAVQDLVLRITLSRPEKRNAFNPEMISALKKAFLGAAKSKCQLVFLSGEGPTFSSGADLEWMKKSARFTKTQNQKDARNLFSMFMAAYTCPLPVVTKVHGHAMGGALGLVAVSDFVAATSETQFAFSEVRVGLAPAVISPFVSIKMRAGPMAQAMLTGEKFLAASALDWGLLSFCGSSAEVDEYLRMLKSRLIEAGPVALSEVKGLLRKLQSPGPKAFEAYTTDLISRLRVGKEGQEGLTAFLEGREPSWRSP